MNEKREGIAGTYLEALESLPWIAPKVRAASKHAWHLFGIRCAERASVQNYLSRSGIATAVHYPYPVHSQPAYANRVIVQNDLSTTEALCDEILSLPMFPELHSADIDLAVSALDSLAHGRTFP